MHERALMQDVLNQVEAVAREHDASRVTRVVVRLGVLSHFTPEHFCEHFADAASGTVAEGAAVEAVVEPALDAPYADGVFVRVVEIELPCASARS